MDPSLLAALAEPNRLRIVELIASAPRPVGEVATELGLRQPQTTKHLQALQRAGLVTMHPLGRRRIYSLERARLRELRAWLERFDEDPSPGETAVTAYQRAVEAETRAAERDPAWADGREIRVARAIAASPVDVWRHWVEPDRVARWWAPDHFCVAACDVDARPGGALRIVMAEGDGTEHAATGSFLDVREPERLRFGLTPLDPEGAPLLDATHDVTLRSADGGTDVAMTIRIGHARPEAAPALAGMAMGWEQLFANLARQAEAGRA